MTAETLLNAYLDLNLLLVAGTLVWLALRWGLRRYGLGQAFLPQLRLLNGLTLLLAMSPVLFLGLTTWVVAHPPNLSDMLVSQYLQGNVSMSASRFEALLGLREDFVREMLNGQAHWAQLLGFVAVCGAVVMLAHVGVSLVTLVRTMRRAFLWKRIGRVDLLVSDDCRVAFSTRGLRRRYIVLPSGLLQSPKDLQLTIAHELQHFRQKDVECEVLLELLRPLLFWNPAFYVWRHHVRHLREYACDQALMARRGFDARAYCECLIRACEGAMQRSVFFARTPSVALVDRREIRRSSTLQNRILAVTEDNPNLGSKTTWLLISGLLIGAVLTTNLIVQRPSDWSHDRIMLSTIVNLERMANRSDAASSPFQGGFVTAITE
jgi:beta-lactamase regulating signal transducer with metallopeptidase domain